MPEVKAQWSFNLPSGIAGPLGSDGQPLPASSSVAIPAQSMALGDVAGALDQLKHELSVLTTTWRDVVGKQEEKVVQERRAAQEAAHGGRKRRAKKAREPAAGAEEEDEEDEEEEEEEDEDDQ